MIAFCILFLSFSATTQFVLAYCRTLLLTYAKADLSQLALEVTGLPQGTWAPHEFHRVMGLARLAPNPRDDAAEVRAITVYYRAMRLAHRILAPFSRAAEKWTHQELSRCTYFAAVTLDRRLLPVLY